MPWVATQLSYCIILFVVNQTNNAISFVLEQLRIVLGLGETGQNHRYLALANSTSHPSTILSLVSYQAVKAGHCQTNH